MHMLKLKREKEDIFEQKVQMELNHEQNIDNKRQKILQDREIKKQHMQNLQNKILNDRKQLVHHIRHRSQLNDEATQDYRQQVTNMKKERADKLKREQRARSNKLRNYYQQRSNSFLHNYLNRTNQEANEAQSLEHKMKSLEEIETELLEKLKNTRANVSKASQEYINALDNSYTSQDHRIQSLKQKLQQKRSKYMKPANGELRNSVRTLEGRDQHNRSKSVK